MKTIIESIKLTGKHIKQNHGPGQFAIITLKINPSVDKEVNLTNKLLNPINQNWIKGIEEGIFHFQSKYKIGFIEIELIDYKEHKLDSSKLCFTHATMNLLSEAFKNYGTEKK
jgi:hypothetical protein